MPQGKKDMERQEGVDVQEVTCTRLGRPNGDGWDDLEEEPQQPPHHGEPWFAPNISSTSDDDALEDAE